MDIADQYRGSRDVLTSAPIDPLPLPDPPLADEAIVLGPFELEDVPELVEICNDQRISHFTFIPAPYELRHAQDFVATQDERRRRRETLDLAIRDAADGTLIGSVGLRAFDWERETTEIGYWVAPHARGRGVAPRAVELFGDWALAALPVRRLELPLDIANDSSRRVAEKARYALTGKQRRLRAKGREWRMDVYAREP